jgi:hypothetical protein
MANNFVSPASQLVSPAGGLIAPANRLMAPANRLIAPAGGLVSPAAGPAYLPVAAEANSAAANGRFSLAAGTAYLPAEGEAHAALGQDRLLAAGETRATLGETYLPVADETRAALGEIYPPAADETYAALGETYLPAAGETRATLGEACSPAEGEAYSRPEGDEPDEAAEGAVWAAMGGAARQAGADAVAGEAELADAGEGFAEGAELAEAEAADGWELARGAGGGEPAEAREDGAQVSPAMPPIILFPMPEDIERHRAKRKIRASRSRKLAEVLRCAEDGLSEREIAQRLDIGRGEVSLILGLKDVYEEH